MRYEKPQLIESVTLHIVKEVIDERGSNGKTLGKVWDHNQAQQLAKGKGAWGGDGEIRKEKYLRVVASNGKEDFYPLGSDRPADLSDVKSREVCSEVNSVLSQLEHMSPEARELLKNSL